jgi:hypothetical protein
MSDDRIQREPTARRRACLTAGLAAIILLASVALGGVRYASAVASLHGGSIYRVGARMSAVRAQDEPFVPPRRRVASPRATRPAFPGAVFPADLPFSDTPLWWPTLAGFSLVAVAVALQGIRHRRRLRSPE